MRLTDNQIRNFSDMIQEIIVSEEFCKMRAYEHHAGGNTYEHSIHVAYLCYCHWIRSACAVDIKELVRGALLHDYFLYDWREGERSKFMNGLLHGFQHPQKALHNALRDYPDLTRIEKDIIKSHMFPLTLVPPRTRSGWLVCFYDKVAAVQEYGHFRRIYLDCILAEE